jgi:hypothetical protein
LNDYCRSRFPIHIFSDIQQKYRVSYFSCTLFRVDVSSGRAETSLFRRVEIEGYSADDFVMEQLFVKSADGTSVPMFVAHRRGLPLDGSSPCHLYGYGGFNISLSPYFSCSRAAFMKGVSHSQAWHLQFDVPCVCVCVCVCVGVSARARLPLNLSAQPNTFSTQRNQSKPKQVDIDENR